jgi:hypothetical protein
LYAIRRRHRGQPAEAVGQPLQVRVVADRVDVPRVQPGRRLEDRLGRGDVGLGGEPDRLGAQDGHAAVPAAPHGLFQHWRARRHRPPGLGRRGRGDAQADGVEPGLCGQHREVRRRDVEQREVVKGEHPVPPHRRP